MRRFSLLLIAALIAPLTQARADGLNPDAWLQLWTRCRIFVEHGTSLDVQGLIDLGSSKRQVAPVIADSMAEPLIPGYEVHERSWEQPGSPFILVEETTPGSRRYCAVRLSPNAPPVTAEDEANLASIFLQERKRLIDTGTHEIRDPAPIFSTNLGVGPIDHNDNGCRVISLLQIDIQPGVEPFFTSASGEQPRCAPQP